MYGSDQVSDKELLKTVNRRLTRGGGGAVTATVQRGNVTLSGKLQYEAQRRPIMKVVSSIAGVRNVSDQLQLVVKRQN